jgi:hypothetical protein
LPYTGKSVEDSVKPLINNTFTGIPTIFRKMKVSVVGKGKILDFDKMNSPIVNKSEQTNLQRVLDTIDNQKDFSPEGMQTTAARINALSKIEQGAKTIKSVIITQIHDIYDKAIKATYPELSTLRNQYKIEKQIISGIDDVIKSVKNDIANPTAVTGVTKKLSNLFAEDNDAYIKALKNLEDKTGVDLLTGLAASEFKNIMPGKLGSVLFQSSALAGGLFFNPLLLVALPLFSPALQGKIITTAGKFIPKLQKIAPKLEQIPKIITPLIRQNQ